MEEVSYTTQPAVGYINKPSYIEKTFTFNSAYANNEVEVEFDFYEIDTWDFERFTVTLKDEIFVEDNFIHDDHEYLKDIHYFCLVMSKKYIENHFADIKNYANAIEQRIDDSWCTLDSTLADNAYSMEMCKKHNCNYILIDEKYQVEPYL